jgi:hypothetical protein
MADDDYEGVNADMQVEKFSEQVYSDSQKYTSKFSAYGRPPVDIKSLSQGDIHLMVSLFPFNPIFISPVTITENLIQTPR